LGNCLGGASAEVKPLLYSSRGADFWFHRNDGLAEVLTRIIKL
jgi:hypothetical protein